MSEQLKPCPFCGGEARILCVTGSGHKSVVQCRQCAASRDSVEFWNRRPALVRETPGDPWAELLTRLQVEKDAAYLERNQVVAALSKCFPAGVSVDPSEPDWPVVLIDLPTGQVSWHFHSSSADLIAHLPPYVGEWDGHDTPEKYRRLAALGETPGDTERLDWLEKQEMRITESAGSPKISVCVEEDVWPRGNIREAIDAAMNTDKPVEPLAPPHIFDRTHEDRKP